MTPRALQLWAAAAGAPARGPGRPAADRSQRLSVLRRVARVVRRLGLAGIGWRAVCAELVDAPRRLVCLALAMLRERRRRRARAVREAVAVHRRVEPVGGVWCLDATQVGRDPTGAAILAEVLIDAASRRLIGLRVGAASCAGDVLELLEAACRVEGGAPLVLQTDNGSAYCNARVAGWLAQRRVLHLRSLPRTPQHNAQAERAIGQLKQAAGIGAGRPAIGSMAHAERVLRVGVDRLHARRRAVLGGRTALEHHEKAPRWYARLTREEVYEDALRRRREALRDTTGKRARRRAERQAILETLQHHQVITVTRGAASIAAVKGEGVW